MVPVVDLDKVQTVLESSGISHWVDEEVISLDGKPEVGVINLGHGSDQAVVQGLLDSIP